MARRRHRVRLLVLDVDGVLTDGRLLYGPRGETLKAFHVRDGHGIKQLLGRGVAIAVISGRRSAAVQTRCRELGIRHVFQGVDDKLACFEALRRKLRCAVAECGAIGDDTPDAPLLRHVGYGFAVADAHLDAQDAARYITRSPGGRGAVREVCDWLVAEGLA
ncbi:MAG: HAD hydrolase family protein [Steroidobacteraceae bacterium]